MKKKIEYSIKNNIQPHSYSQKSTLIYDLICLLTFSIEFEINPSFQNTPFNFYEQTIALPTTTDVQIQCFSQRTLGTSSKFLRNYSLFKPNSIFTVDNQKGGGVVGFQH